MRLFLPLCLVLLAATSMSRLPLAALTADQIARQVQDRDTGRDSRAEFRMKLFDRRGRARERALTLLTLRGRQAPGAPKTAPDGDRLLIRFTYPNDIRGTAFLVWKHPTGEDERFLFLPSLGRVRRIAGSEAQESFVGSDFSYEDIGGRDVDDYSYALLDENASWSGPGRAPHPAYRLESRRKDRSVEFPRVVSLVLKDTFLVIQADIFNRRDEKLKVYAVKRLEQIQRIWTVMESSMSNDLERTRTELVIEKIEYNTGVTEDGFSRRALEAASPPRGGATPE
jgi:Outer membrane lipoprotein-sorting protein